MTALALTIAMSLAAMEVALEGQLQAFPPRTVVAAEIKFGGQHCHYLRKAMEDLPFNTRQYKWLDFHFQYVVKAWQFWKRLQKAQRTEIPIGERLEALNELNDLLRGDTFLAGMLPPLTCYWHFLDGPPPPNLLLPQERKLGSAPRTDAN